MDGKKEEQNTKCKKSKRVKNGKMQETTKK